MLSASARSSAISSSEKQLGKKDVALLVEGLELLGGKLHGALPKVAAVTGSSGA